MGSALLFMIIKEYTKDNGQKMLETEKGWKYFQMEINISENIKKEKLMDKENTFGAMETFMKETGLMELEKEMENGKIQKGNPMLVNGKIQWLMV